MARLSALRLRRLLPLLLTALLLLPAGCTAPLTSPGVLASPPGMPAATALEEEQRPDGLPTLAPSLPPPPTLTAPATTSPPPRASATPTGTEIATATIAATGAPTTLTTSATAPAAPATTATPPRPPVTAATTLAPAPVGASPPSLREATVSILTYNYEAAFIPTAPEDEIYPYPRLDPARVGAPAARSYRALILENGYVSLTILPELGGRIYRWVDKATGRDLLYRNPVIKPTVWGYRGWWLAAGGMEWSFPVEDHGLDEWRPWQVSSGSSTYGRSVTVSDVDDRTGMEVGVTISLDTGHAYVTIQPWVRNNTGEAHPYQLWLNAMLTLGGNRVSPETRVILPAGQVLVHSTADGGVPASGSSMSWPLAGGRDMSRYGNWNGYLGFFVPEVAHGFSGLYDPLADQGIVRAYTPGWPAGTKIFGPATLSPTLWTDDDSNYVELWSGATASFWSNATLAPGEQFSWTEYWYPIHGTGVFDYANRTAALRLDDNGSSAEIGVATSTLVEGTLTLFAGGQAAAEWSLRIVAGQAFRATWQRPAGADGPLGLRFTAAGATVAQTGAVP